MSNAEREIKLAVPEEFTLPPLTDAGADVFAAPPDTLEPQFSHRTMMRAISPRAFSSR